MNTNSYIGWCGIILLLGLAIYSEFMLGNAFVNALLDVALTFVVFYFGYNDANKKTASLENKIQELQNRIEQLEARDQNPTTSNEESKPTTSPSQI